jgi:hypothetical protein
VKSPRATHKKFDRVPQHQKLNKREEEREEEKRNSG